MSFFNSNQRTDYTICFHHCFLFMESHVLLGVLLPTTRTKVHVFVVNMPVKICSLNNFWISNQRLCEQLDNPCGLCHGDTLNFSCGIKKIKGTFSFQLSLQWSNNNLVQVTLPAHLEGKWCDCLRQKIDVWDVVVLTLPACLPCFIRHF